MSPGSQEELGFLQRRPDGRFELRAAWDHEGWPKLLPHVSGTCRDKTFLMYRCKMNFIASQIALSATDLFVSANSIGDESGGGDAGSLIDGVAQIYFQMVPDSVGDVFGISKGMPIVVGNDVISPVDPSLLGEPARYDDSNMSVLLYRKSLHYDERVRHLIAESESERITLSFVWTNPISIEEVRLVAKVVRIFFANVSGNPVVDAIDVRSGTGVASSWECRLLVPWSDGGARSRFRIRLTDVDRTLALVHDFVVKLLATPHVVEVLYEIETGDVSSRYQITLLGTAWEHVITNMHDDSKVQVRARILEAVSTVVRPDSDATGLVDLAWNTYTKLKHRELYQRRSERTCIDDFDESDAATLARFMAEVLVMVVFVQMGETRCVTDLAINIWTRVVGDGEFANDEYDALARKYRVGSYSPRSGRSV